MKVWQWVALVAMVLGLTSSPAHASSFGVSLHQPIPDAVPSLQGGLQTWWYGYGYTTCEGPTLQLQFTYYDPVTENYLTWTGTANSLTGIPVTAPGGYTYTGEISKYGIPNYPGCLEITVATTAPGTFQGQAIQVPVYGQGKYFVKVGSGICGNQPTSPTVTAKARIRVLRDDSPIATQVYIEDFQDRQERTQFGTTNAADGRIEFDVNGGKSYRVHVPVVVQGETIVVKRDVPIGTYKSVLIEFNINSQTGDDTGSNSIDGDGFNLLNVAQWFEEAMQKLFVPQQSTIEAFLNAIKEFWMWGPIEVITELTALFTQAPGAQHSGIPIPIPVWNGTTWVQDPQNRSVNITFDPVTNAAGFTQLRSFMGMAVFIGFGVFIVRQMQPKHVV